MELLSTPIIKSTIINNDKEILEVEFYYNGNQSARNQLIISNNISNTEVYNQTIDSFQLKHTVKLSLLIPNVQYKIKIKVFDVKGNCSNFSDETLFSYFVKPELEIKNIVDNTINNQSFTFQGFYNQPNDKLISYRFLLYDENNILIGDSKNKFDGFIRHEFTGFNNNTQYKVKLQTISEHEVETETPLYPFTCKFTQPKINTELSVKNNSKNASVDILAEVIQVLGQVEGGIIEYENGDYVNLKHSKISFEKGLKLDSNNFTIQLFVKDIMEDITFLRLYDNYSLIELKYYNKKIHLLQSTINRRKEYLYHIVSDELDITSNDDIYIYIIHNYQGWILKAKKI